MQVISNLQSWSNCHDDDYNEVMDQIKSQVSRVISYSQNIPEPQVNDLINKWYNAKKQIIKMFHGSLIYEYGYVEFHLSDSVKSSKVTNFIDRVVNTYGNDALGKFVSENREGFFNNQVIKDYDNIPRGMKLVRAFKYFEPENKHLLETIQNEASQIIQEDKICGTLCFSVHPLDFLSSSCNTYKWRSCHSLDGEYRAGNLSYMLDSSTFMCYLKGQDGVEIPFFPPEVKWNSKKWRTLLYLSDNRDMMFAGRQYPFSTDNALDVIKQALKKLIAFTALFTSNLYYSENNWEHYVVDWPDLFSKYIKYNHRLVAINDMVTDVSNLHYDDLKWSNFYNPYYIVDKFSIYNDKDDNYIPHFTIGAKVKCLHCGQENIAGGESMRCDHCESLYGTEENDEWGHCDICGARVRWDDMEYMEDDTRLCPHCYETETCKCPRCDQVVFRNDMIYHAGDDEYYCEVCIHEIMEEDYPNG